MTLRRFTPKPAKQMDGYTPKPRAAAVPRHDVPARLCVPVPKGVKAKPGKRQPTAEERDWMDAITAHGCVACRKDGRGYVPAAVHHILRGGQRIGPLFTLPLCDPGHHQNGQALGLTSRHPWKARFEAQYGGEMELLEALRAELMHKEKAR